MKIIFLGTTGVHAALVAAYIYLGKLNKRDLSEIESLGDVRLESQNKLLFIGSDKYGNGVYTFGAGKEVSMVKKSIEDLRDLLGYKEDDLIVVTNSAPGDRLLALLLRIPVILGGQTINRKLSRLMLTKYFEQLSNSIAHLKLTKIRY